jgi:hypothetical protein
MLVIRIFSRSTAQIDGVLEGAWKKRFPSGVRSPMPLVHQPYEDQERGSDIVRRLQNMNFPELGDGGLDTIIDQC